MTQASPLKLATTGQGSPLVLLHGWGANRAVWQFCVDYFKEHYQVINIDLPGYGDNFELTVPSFDACVDLIAQAIPEQSEVLAWSMSGLLATQLAKLAPTKVKRLALVCSSPCFVNQADWQYGLAPDVLAQFSAQLETNHAATLSRFLALQSRGSSQANDTLKQLRKACLKTRTPTLETLALGLDWLKYTDVRTTLSQLQQALLFVFGQHDTIVRPRLSQALQTLCPQATFALIAGAAHAPFVSHPKEFCQLVERFLSVNP